MCVLATMCKCLCGNAQQKINDEFERLMWVLWGENIIECNMKYPYVNIACPSKMLRLLLMFHIICLTNTTKFEFVKRQYLHELMQTLT
jgi:hypothetical protein